MIHVACKTSETSKTKSLISKLFASNTTHSISYVTVIKHCIIYQIFTQKEIFNKVQ